MAPVGGAVAVVEEPAAPRVKAPEHTDITQAPRSTASRSTLDDGGDGRARPRSEAGTATRSASAAASRPCGRRHGRAVAGVERARGLGAHAVVEGGHALVGAVDAEHLGEHPVLEEGDRLLEEDGDGTQCHADQYGRKLTYNDISATRGSVLVERQTRAMDTNSTLETIVTIAAIGGARGPRRLPHGAHPPARAARARRPHHVDVDPPRRRHPPDRRTRSTRSTAQPTAEALRPDPWSDGAAPAAQPRRPRSHPSDETDQGGHGVRPVAPREHRQRRGPQVDRVLGPRGEPDSLPRGRQRPQPAPARAPSRPWAPAARTAARCTRRTAGAACRRRPA